MRCLVALLLLLLGASPALAAERSIEEAAGRLESTDPRTRLAAVARLSRCGRGPECARAKQALERALFDPEAVVRRASVNGLAALRARAATGSIVKLLEIEQEPEVIAAALVAMGGLRASRALALFVHFASDPRPAVRAAALTGAGDLGGPAARRLIANSLQMAGTEDADWIVRAAGLLALARTGTREDLAVARRVYVQGRGDRYWLARSTWARVVAALDPSPRGELERLLLDPDARVAVTAAASLARAGHGEVVVRNLRHSQPAVRAAAIGGVRQAKLTSAYQRLRTLARYDPSRKVRWAAIVALFALEDPDGDELMLDALRSSEPAIWAEAVARLSQRTGARHGRDVRAWRAELRRRRRR